MQTPIQITFAKPFAAKAINRKRRESQIRWKMTAHEGPLQCKMVENRDDEDHRQFTPTEPRLISVPRRRPVDGSFDQLQARGAVVLVVQIGAFESDPTTKPCVL